MGSSSAAASADEIVETLGFFDDWEDRYRYIIDLGRELPEMPVERRRDELLVRGCQSQVWLDWQEEDGRIVLEADSDALIVRGLIALILAVYDRRTPREILNFDIEGYFTRLDLLRHISQTRGNGLRAMVQRIRDVAQVRSVA
ncbi:MAG: SufE family protein [Pseudomonadales bacterium]|jgi:cysteine desulfuration protein SufE|nr:SufE family protein [Pseudomonadales bacterium]MCP5319482.1 SufE family protein [Pseudomonadales bacterium]MCP5337020.1 SufE family protein [Pseudomonadales bacterium]